MLNSMNIYTDNEAMASDLKRGTLLDHFRSWSIRWKIQLIFLLSTLTAGCIIVSIVFIIQRRVVIRETYNKLLLLQNEKSGHVEDYFSNLDNQIRIFSSDRQTIEALNSLSESFLNIENDNFSTPTAAGLDKMNTLLEGFYASEVIPVLEASKDQSANLQTLLPADNKQRIMQYLYLAGNSKPLALKGTLNKADDGSAYSSLHAQYHPSFLKFARQSGINDIILIDYKTGYVTYSLKKNLDFASNLFDGPYKNTALALAFKSAIGQSTQGSVSYIDETQYVPALLNPLMFISTPVITGGRLIGVVVFALDAKALDKLLMLDKEGLSSGKSMKTIIIGQDYYYRNNDPEFVSNREDYLRKLRRNCYMGGTGAIAERLKTTAMVQQVDVSALPDVIKKKTNRSHYISETGERILCVYKPLAINNLNWTLVTQINKSDALSPLTRSILTVVIIALMILGLLFYFVGLFIQSLSKRIGELKNNLISLANGEPVQFLNNASGDEIGQSINTLGKISMRINTGSEFVSEMSKGNIEADFPVTSDTDRYGIAMNSLKKSLAIRKEDEEQRKKEDEIRNWTTHGIALFNDILRMDNNNLEKLTLNIIRNIIQYLSANQGGFFLIEDDDDTKYLNLIASYAYNRQKFLKKRIDISEGLVGTCALEKKTILLKKIPEDYIEITSGLGGARPGCLLIVPLKKDEDVLGVLEVASFNDFKPHEVEFVEKIAESIASALVTVRLHLQTSLYLERFQQQTEEMKAQDEELRQNIEELQATHEQMERLKQEENERNQKMIKEMEDYRRLLISVLNEVPEKIFLKDDQGRFVIANKLVSDNYNRSVEEILGKSDFDFYSSEVASQNFKREQEIIKSGVTQSFEEGDPSKEDGLIVRSIKKPFFIEHLGVTGLFGVQFDISDIKRKEYEALKMAEEIKEKQHVIEVASVELMKEKALMDALMNNIPELIYFKDKESKFIRVSRSMLKQFGLNKPEELVGKSDFDFFADEHARPAFEDEQRIINTGKAILDLEEKEVMSDGRVNWVNTTKMPLYDTDGNIIGTFGVTKTITHLKMMQQEASDKTEELKSQEEELRQNLEEMQTTQEDMRRQIEENKKIQEALGKEKALMDALLDNVPESIYFKDKESRFIRFSKSMLKLFGLKNAEDLVGKSDFDFFSEEHATPAFESEQRIIKTGKAIVDLEEKEILEDGRVNWVNTTKMPLMDSAGNIIGTFGISKNITNIKRLQQDALEKTEELRAQEEELRQNIEEMQSTQEDLRRQMEERAIMQEALSKEKALMDALLDNVPESIYFKDKESRFIRFSKSMLKLFGLKKAEDLVGKSDFDFFSEEHARPAFESEQRIITTGKAIVDLEEKEVMEDGRVNWVNTTKMPLMDSEGNIIGTFGISKNITHIKRLQQDALEKTEELRAQEEELKQNLEEMQSTQEDMMRQIEEKAKMQEALSKEKALMDALLDNVPESIYFKDKESRFIRFSKSMLKLFGLTKAEDLVGKSDFDFFSEEHARPAFEDEQRIIKTKKAIIDLEEKEVMADGRTNWVNTTKMPLMDSKDNVIGTFGISKSITHLKKMELEVNEKAKRIKETEKKLAALEKEIEVMRKKGSRK
jgi:PAS domain S-box-containing protein